MHRLGDGELNVHDLVLRPFGRVLDEGRFAVGLLHEDARAKDLLIEFEGFFGVSSKVQINMDELHVDSPKVWNSGEQKRVFRANSFRASRAGAKQAARERARRGIPIGRRRR